MDKFLVLPTHKPEPQIVLSNSVKFQWYRTYPNRQHSFPKGTHTYITRTSFIKNSYNLLLMLLKGGTVLTPSGWKKQDVEIEGTVIKSVGPSSKSDDVIDCSNSLIMPAFCNMHTHVAMSIMRNVGEGLSLHDWLKKNIWPREEKLTREDIYYSSLLSSFEMLLSGTSCFNDMYWKFPEEIERAARDAGIRSVVSLDVALAKEPLKSVEGFVREGRATAVHSIYAGEEEAIIKMYELSQQKKVPFHIHIAETREELFISLKRYGKRPVEYLDSLGVLGPNTILAHSSWITVREMDMIAKSFSTIVHCPTSNLKLATGGICPLHEVQKRGVNITLATDGPASNNSQNMFETLKLAGLLQKHKYWDAKLGEPDKLLAFSSINGFKALSINAGTIEEGKEADIVVVERAPNLYPLNDPSTAIVYSADRANVSHVFVKGEHNIVDGKIREDKEQLLNDALSYVEKRAYELREL
ncbi:MAG: amidohydrolase [Methanobacteriota archaeon]|nr:MAG: amidohydrolase [Euryarchaeota archaeon]